MHSQTGDRKTGQHYKWKISLTYAMLIATISRGNHATVFGNMHGDWSANMDMGIGMGMGLGVGMWLFWIAIIVVVVLAFKLLTNRTSGQSSTPTESALEILRKRYARGEIDSREYERMKNELEN
jgi:putative membrane protein